jgi:putative hydrolase of the HAD superfamily
MFQALLVDAAGTLIQTVEPVGEVYSRHFKAYGLSLSPAPLLHAFTSSFAAFDPDYAAHDSGDAAEYAYWRDIVLATLLASGPEAAAFARSAAFPASFDALYDYYAAPDAWILFPDTLDFLDRAAPLARLAVVSNFDQRLIPILHGLGLATYFERIITSSRARSAKPDPGIFRLALQEMALSPGQAAHVGDCPQADLAGAQNAGLHAFHLQRPDLNLLDFLIFCQSARI